MIRFQPSRRTILSGLSGMAAATLLATPASARIKANLVVIGGGFGGATAARALKRLLPQATVTLIEQSPTYTACPFSNLVIGGVRDLSTQAFSYGALSRDGIDVKIERAANIDANTRTVTLESGARLPFDRLILSPGIDIRWNALEGYSEAASNIMPHAWKAGAQTRLLRKQLEELTDGGVVAMSIPAAPFRCPPGPYERASLIAHYLKTHKPKSKLILLDAKDTFSKQPLFLSAWEEMYGDILEWRGASDDGRVSRVDSETMTLETDFETLNADVANVIPPQKAGAIAEIAGVTDATGWCPINATSFESTRQPNIHVIGDASIAAPMPKSAFSANLQAKVCAIQIARLLADLPAQATVLANTCYSYTAPDAAVSIAGVYHNTEETFTSVAGAGGLSPLKADAGVRAQEAAQAADWFNAITDDAFG